MTCSAYAHAHRPPPNPRHRRIDKQNAQWSKQSLPLIKDLGAWFLRRPPWGQVLNGESSYRQAVFTSRKGVLGSHDFAI